MGAFNLRICALAACLLLASQASGYTMEEMCAQWSGTGYVGNPSNCRAWGYCQGQKLLGWGTCPNDYVFNSQKGSCGYANSTVCATSAVDTCKAAASPMYVADPQNCTQYCYCNGKGDTEYGNCGVGGVYSAGTGKCVWGPTCPQDNICRFMLNGIYVGDPANCGSYIACNNGVGTAGKCGTDLTYNLANGYCQTTNNCDGDNSNSGSDGEFTINEPDTTICAKNWEAAEFPKVGTVTQTYKYVSDDTTCYGYYYCATKEGTGYWNECPTGTQFNQAAGKCVSPASFSCAYDRCGNVNSQFMTVLNSNCQKYKICASSVVQSCPNNLYYDEVYNICTTDEPTYAICKAT
ncbi:peritrophin-44 isoform X1 [Drosophila rhopaloa]|uniref:Chitin-binding type-2 domain-containing protein n=1 Tax=Drosophila rhopaloa TaxID=1041015 RepID=A0ABM5JFB9_DRORH|nr:peritrophin-44 isoform X1 [Drosophila rhopaloa]